MAVWHWLAAASLAPVAVWLLWRVQVLAVELLRQRMVKLVRHTSWLYTMVSWFGTLLHEISHATVLLLSGHGIKDFSVRSETGHVTPRHSRRGPAAFLSYLAAAMAPMYIPPALVLVGLIWLVDRSLVPWQAVGPGLDPAIAVFADLALDFPLALASAVGRLDLVRPGHIAVFLLVLLGAPGSRPSHVKGSRFHSRDDEGDIAVLRRRIRSQPWFFVAFVAVLYGAYFALVPWLPAAYWYPFQAVWATALTGVLLALFGAAWWSVTYLNTRIQLFAAWLPPAVLVAGQAVPRVMELGWDVLVINVVSVAGWALAAVVLAYAMPRRR